METPPSCLPSHVWGATLSQLPPSSPTQCPATSRVLVPATVLSIGATCECDGRQGDASLTSSPSTPTSETSLLNSQNGRGLSSRRFAATRPSDSAPCHVSHHMPPLVAVTHVMLLPTGGANGVASERDPLTVVPTSTDVHLPQQVPSSQVVHFPPAALGTSSEGVAEQGNPLGSVDWLDASCSTLSSPLRFGPSLTPAGTRGTSPNRGAGRMVFVPIEVQPPTTSQQHAHRVHTPMWMPPASMETPSQGGRGTPLPHTLPIHMDGGSSSADSPPDALKCPGSLVPVVLAARSAPEQCHSTMVGATAEHTGGYEPGACYATALSRIPSLSFDSARNAAARSPAAQSDTFAQMLIVPSSTAGGVSGEGVCSSIAGAAPHIPPVVQPYAALMPVCGTTQERVQCIVLAPDEQEECAICLETNDVAAQPPRVALSTVSCCHCPAAQPPCEGGSPVVTVVGEEAPSVNPSALRTSVCGVRCGSPMIRLGFCGHCFHENCLQRWLLHHKQCPTCRRDLSNSH